MVSCGRWINSARLPKRETRSKPHVRNEGRHNLLVLLTLGFLVVSRTLASWIPTDTYTFAGEVPSGGLHAGESSQLRLLRRSVAQDQGAWVIDYEVRYPGSTGVILTPTEIGASVEGWVSNSRVATHAVPRLAHAIVSAGSGASSTVDVISSSDETQRCRERAIISVWTDDSPLPDPNVASLLSLAPRASVHIRLRLEHQHVLYGDYDPLLGVRNIELTLGRATLRDQVALNHEHYLAQPRYIWPEPPEDRRDTRQFVSAPDSLHLEAHVPGHMYYRYPEHPVRYGSKMRLRFWYLIAVGTEGDCRVRLAQYKDTPTSWRPLSNGGIDQTLDVVGRWTKVEKIVRAECEATTVALDFRIVGETNVGEMWIDDVSLEPVACATNAGGP